MSPPQVSAAVKVSEASQEEALTGGLVGSTGTFPGGLWFLTNQFHQSKYRKKEY